jgi:hypothetical protein
MSRDPVYQQTTQPPKGSGQQPGSRGRPGDPLAWFTGALILIWAGFVLLLRNAGEVLGLEIQYASAWILTGSGVLLWIEAILRLAIPAYTEGVGTRIIMGVIFIIVGLGEVIEISLWPLLLVTIGLVMIGGYFMYPRRT